MKWGKIVIFSHFFIKAHRIPFSSKFAKTIKVLKLIALIAQHTQLFDYQYFLVQ